MLQLFAQLHYRDCDAVVHVGCVIYAFFIDAELKNVFLALANSTKFRLASHGAWREVFSYRKLGPFKFSCCWYYRYALYPYRKSIWQWWAYVCYQRVCLIWVLFRNACLLSLCHAFQNRIGQFSPLKLTSSLFLSSAMLKKSRCQHSQCRHSVKQWRPIVSYSRRDRHQLQHRPSFRVTWPAQPSLRSVN